MSDTRISWAPLGTTQVRSGCDPERALSRAPSGSGEPAVSSSAATARAAERIREVVMDPELDIGPRAEALLYAAARAQLVEEAISPLLEHGTWVLLDRFVDSSLAYQGAGRELGMDAVRLINNFATGGLRPDRTLLLVLDLELARARSQGRGQPSDRLEGEERDFFARTSQA